MRFFAQIVLVFSTYSEASLNPLRPPYPNGLFNTLIYRYAWHSRKNNKRLGNQSGSSVGLWLVTWPTPSLTVSSSLLANCKLVLTVAIPCHAARAVRHDALYAPLSGAPDDGFDHLRYRGCRNALVYRHVAAHPIRQWIIQRHLPGGLPDTRRHFGAATSIRKGCTPWGKDSPVSPHPCCLPCLSSWHSRHHHIDCAPAVTGRLQKSQGDLPIRLRSKSL